MQLKRDVENMGRVEGKTAIVTGSGRGIGRAITLCLAREGAHVVVNASRNIDEANGVVQEISAMGGKAIAGKADVGNWEGAEAFVRTCLDNFGKIDILVNNAGIARSAMCYKMTEHDWDEVMTTNLKGAFNCIRACAPHMMNRKYGRIVNISSYAAAGGMIGNINYAASKGGINAVTVTAAKELAKYGIWVNAVAPGTIVTEMTSYLDSGPKLKEYYLSLVPMERFGQPEEVASVVLFLASDEASYVTGQIITVSGGKQ